MARSKLPEDTVIRLLKCQRWGVCDEGTADTCAVDFKTVLRFQHVVAQRAETHIGRACSTWRWRACNGMRPIRNFVLNRSNG